MNIKKDLCNVSILILHIFVTLRVQKKAESFFDSALLRLIDIFCIITSSFF